MENKPRTSRNTWSSECLPRERVVREDARSRLFWERPRVDLGSDGQSERMRCLWLESLFAERRLLFRESD